jgi:membrane protein YqaA with SNARE-associated domain
VTDYNQHDRKTLGTGSAALLDECRRTWDAWERFSATRGAAVLMFAWALAEATVWPIIPDFLLVPLAAGSRRRLYVPLAASIGGSALGGIALFLFALQVPQAALTLLQHLPLVTEHQVELAHQQLDASGPQAFFFQPWSGVSFKVWAILAAAQQMDPATTIPIFILARALRMTIFAVVAGLIASRVRGFMRDFSLYVALVYVVVFGYGFWELLA